MVNEIFRMYLMLLNNKKLTAKTLSDTLGVSTRTIYRYVDELSYAHIPVYAEKGQHGGIYLCEESKLYATSLTKEEQNVLLSAIDMLEGNGNIEIAETLKCKILALNHTDSDVFSLSNKRIVIDNSYIAKNTKTRAKVTAIDRALSKRNVLEINYHDRHGNVSTRQIEPISFVIQEGTWYIYAWCRMRQSTRLFKLSRISHIKNTEEIFTRRNVDKNWTLSFSDNSEYINLYLEVDESARYDVEEWLGIDSISTKNGKNIAIATIKDNESLYARLLSFAGKVKVLEPTSVVTKLKDMIAELSNIY